MCKMPCLLNNPNAHENSKRLLNPQIKRIAVVSLSNVREYFSILKPNSSLVSILTKINLLVEKTFYLLVPSLTFEECKNLYFFLQCHKVKRILHTLLTFAYTMHLFFFLKSFFLYPYFIITKYSELK